MPMFQWEGKTRDGAIRTGVISAQNDQAVIAGLREQHIMATKVKAKAKDLDEYLAFLQPSVGAKDLVIFTRQLATMIDAGLPLVQCLDILGTSNDNKTFKKVIMDVKGAVESGGTFSEALARHPRVFDNLFVNLVAAGEVGGILDTILNRLAAYMEKAAILKRRVKSAMVYPISVTVIAVVIVVMMLVKVIPVFEKMFADFGGELPGPTQVVVAMSHNVQQYLFHGIAVVIALFFIIRRIYRTEKGRFYIDALLLKLPVLGNLIRKVAVARFSRTLATMLTSGVPILEALEIVARTAGNAIVEREILMAKAAIAEGKTIAEPLQNSKVFPSMVVQMIGVGEQTGAMDAMLGKIADFYDDEVDAAVTGLTSLLEPVMMVVLGGSIGSLLIAMYLPIFKIAETVG